MREIDRLTTEAYGIPSVLLMDSASASCLAAILAHYKGNVAGVQALVLCGKGNNGGDGAGLAQLLAEAGAECTVVLFGLLTETRGDARTNFEHITREADSGLLTLVECDDVATWEELSELNHEYDLIV